MATFQHVPGRTIEVELDFRDRALLLQAVRTYIDSAKRCQACGRPDKEEGKRDLNKELAILDRLNKLLDRRVIDEYNESLELELSSANDDFLKAFDTAKTLNKFVHYTGSEHNIPFAYKDATGKLIKRPKMTPEQEDGVDKLKELYGSISVAFPMGLYAYCKTALEGMAMWTAYGAESATKLNSKFGVGALSPDLEPIRADSTKQQ